MSKVKSLLNNPKSQQLCWFLLKLHVHARTRTSLNCFSSIIIVFVYCSCSIELLPHALPEQDGRPERHGVDPEASSLGGLSTGVPALLVLREDQFVCTVGNGKSVCEALWCGTYSLYTFFLCTGFQHVKLSLRLFLFWSQDRACHIADMTWFILGLFGHSFICSSFYHLCDAVTARIVCHVTLCHNFTIPRFLCRRCCTALTECLRCWYESSRQWF